MIASIIILVAILLIALGLGGAYQRIGFWKFILSLFIGLGVLIILLLWVLVIFVIVHFIIKYW
jgi:hypothetical protein